MVEKLSGSERRAESTVRKLAVTRSEDAQEREDESAAVRKVGMDEPSSDVEIDRGEGEPSSGSSSSSPSSSWSLGERDDGGDKNIDAADSVDRKVVAGMLIRVDLALVCSPRGLPQLSRVFGLVASSFLDILADYDSDLAEDMRRAWNTVEYFWPETVRKRPRWEERYRLLRQTGVHHVKRCFPLYRSQMGCGF